MLCISLGTQSKGASGHKNVPQQEVNKTMIRGFGKASSQKPVQRQQEVNKTMMRRIDKASSQKPVQRQQVVDMAMIRIGFGTIGANTKIDKAREGGRHA